MSYLVTVTFDLDSRRADLDAWERVTRNLDRLGLHRSIASSDGSSEARLPENTYVGKFDGVSTVSVRDSVKSWVKEAFIAANAPMESFYICVGDGWAWSV
jgi:hypothetical protein